MINKKESGITLEDIRTGNNAALHYSHALFTGGDLVLFIRFVRLRVAISPEALLVWRGIKHRDAA